MLETVKDAVPMLVSVTGFALLLVRISCVVKLRLVGERVTAGATPVPVSATKDTPALLQMSRVPVCPPKEAGDNVTLNVHWALGISVVEQLLVSANAAPL